MRTLYLALMRWWVSIRGVVCGNGVCIRGFPILFRHPQARIELGDRVILHSRPGRYHAHMHSPVKLLADRAGAVISIGEETRINGACIHAVRSVSIGARCLIAAGVQVLDSNAHESCLDDPARRIASVDGGRPIVIENDVWLGLNAIVLAGAHIGEGSIIGAGAVVSGRIPPRSVVKQAAVQIIPGEHHATMGGDSECPA